METTLCHRHANVVVENSGSGQNKIDVELLNSNALMPTSSCETSYPIDLIKKILEAKGPAYLCDEILRDESPDYVQKNLKYDLLSYLDVDNFKNKRVFDFGCGSGSSTMVLARMFPDAEIVGAELEERLLLIAKLRASYYGYKNIDLRVSPNPCQLPPNIGKFDYIVLSAVYEHLLPNERVMLLPKLWNILKPGGILFLNQTPYRYFPIETHTTNGLPLINYLPDRAALFYARHFAKNKLKSCNWEELLRRGIRGGSIKEILKILPTGSGEPILLNPSNLEAKDTIDLWYLQSSKSNFALTKKLFLLAIKLLKALTGITMLPYLSLGIQKSNQ